MEAPLDGSHGLGMMVVQFDLSNFKEWYKEFEALLDTGHFEGLGIQATFVGRQRKSAGLFSTVDVAHIIHVYPLTKEASATSAYNETSADVSKWLKTKLVTSAISTQTFALAFSTGDEVVDDCDTMTTVLYSVAEVDEWLKVVKASEVPHSKLLVGTAAEAGMAVYLFSAAHERDIKAALTVGDEARVGAPPAIFQSKLLFKKI